MQKIPAKKVIYIYIIYIHILKYYTDTGKQRSWIKRQIELQRGRKRERDRDRDRERENFYHYKSFISQEGKGESGGRGAEGAEGEARL